MVYYTHKVPAKGKKAGEKRKKSMEKSYFTSYAPLLGQPDKVCDEIADGILDALLQQDPHSRGTIEVSVTEKLVHIFGETESRARADCEGIARKVLRRAGYTEEESGLSAENCRVQVHLHAPSPDVLRGMDRRREAEQQDQGAGSQGTAFGFACRETESLMPLPIEAARALARRVEQGKEKGLFPQLFLDGKSQITVEYENGVPARIAAVVLSVQHKREETVEKLRQEVLEKVIRPALPKGMADKKTQYFINPTGRFAVGGALASVGLTGRKLSSDTYGGYARWGGGAISGKDGSKVDRFGAYAARYLAKNIVHKGLAERCEVRLSYAVGLAEPLSLGVSTFGTGKVPEGVLAKAIEKQVDLRPACLMERLGLNRPVFAPLSCYGHFGRSAEGCPWEKTDLQLKV